MHISVDGVPHRSDWLSHQSLSSRSLCSQRQDGGRRLYIKATPCAVYLCARFALSLSLSALFSVCMRLVSACCSRLSPRLPAAAAHSSSPCLQHRTSFSSSRPFVFFAAASLFSRLSLLSPSRLSRPLLSRPLRKALLAAVRLFSSSSLVCLSSRLVLVSRLCLLLSLPRLFLAFSSSPLVSRLDHHHWRRGSRAYEPPTLFPASCDMPDVEYQQILLLCSRLPLLVCSSCSRPRPPTAASSSCSSCSPKTCCRLHVLLFWCRVLVGSSWFHS